MNPRARALVGIFAAAALLFVQRAAADPRTAVRQKMHRDGDQGAAVFVTGSLLPQRVKLEPIATQTSSPLRVINRRELDRTRNPDIARALASEPSLRVIGH